MVVKMAGYTQFWILCVLVAVGCDGVLGSGKRADKCGVCAGNNSTCHIISGIFTRTSLPYGYNRVTSIPAGACHLNVTEMLPSNNYMAIKYSRGRYIFNGNWALGYTNTYEGAGTTFQYNRANPNNPLHPQESILAPGPINSSIDIMMIKQSDNRGILYSYTIPTTSSTSSSSSSSKHRRSHQRRHHRRNSHRRQTDTDADATPKALSKADDILSESSKHQAPSSNTNSITLKSPPVRLDDKPTAALTIDQPQGDEQPDYQDRYREYLDKLRQQQQEQRRARTQQRRDQQAQARKEQEQREERRAQEVRRAQEERNAERSRQETLRDYARNTGFQAKQYENVYRNNYPASSATGAGSAAGGGAGIAIAPQGPLPLQTPPTQYQMQNRQVIPATNYGYPLPSSGNTYNPSMGGSTPNRYPLLPNPYPATGNAVAGQRTYPLANAGNIRGTNPGASYPIPGANYPGQQQQRRLQQQQQQQQQQQVISAYKPGYQAEFPAQNSRGTSRVFPASSSSSSSSAAGAGVQPLPQPGGFPVLSRQPAPYRVPGGGGDLYAYRPQPLVGTGRTLNDQVAALSLPPGSSTAGGRGSLGLGGVQLGVYASGSGDYGWKISGFTDCSATCGGGSQNTVVVCVRLNSQTVVTDNNCLNAIRPKVQAVVCNNLVCPPDWVPGVWGPCSTSCDTGQQSREVRCKQRLSAALALDVAGNECDLDTRPPTVQRCNDEKPCVGWKIGEWNQCSSDCGRGHRTREVVCMTAEGRVTAENKCRTGRPLATEICDMGSCVKTWFFTEWAEECSSECGDGVYSRNVHCSAAGGRCSAISKPAATSACRNDIPCGGLWFTGPWSKCSAACGEGLTERAVVCMKRLGGLMAAVSEENCLLGEKPITEQVCQRDPCRPQWYMTEWTECSRSCGGGIGTREVKCLDALQQPSPVCPLDDKPTERQACNTYQCPEMEGTQKHQGCSDKFKNCRTIVQARLCRFEYYKEVCCFSCSSRDHHARRRKDKQTDSKPHAST